MDQSPGSPRSHLISPARSPGADQIATALADAFLAADPWAPSPLRRAGYDVLGSRRRFVPPLVEAILEAHHRAPRDAPRELATLILVSPGFADAIETARRRGRPVRIAHRLVTATRARDEATRILRLDTVRDLASALDLDLGHLDWFADTGHWNRLAPPGPLQHYGYEWRHRPGRVPRLLEVPRQRLRDVQRRVLDEVLALLPLHDAAHGFVPGRSAASGASRHVGREIVVSADLVSFFARVSARRVYSIVRQAGYPEAVAFSLTGLCTHVVPPRVLSAMPPGGSPEERFALRKALALPHLPQGSPTSPMLANLAVRRLDSRLAGWARATDAHYTRYADDLAFSGDGQLASRVDAFVRGVGRIVEAEGHSLNPHKTRIRRRGARQSVTGIVVNDGLRLGRREVDALRATLHNCLARGPEGENRAGHPDFRAHLLGRISWVAALDTARGTKLRAEFDRIVW